MNKDKKKILEIINNLAHSTAISALGLVYPGKPPNIHSVEYKKIKDRWVTFYKEQYKIEV
jgi:hypothetical protein